MHDQSLRELAEQKEREWRELQELRTQSLEEALKEKERQLGEEKSKFQKLKEDFKYNYKLLQERDLELERYDSIFGDLKATSSAKNAEISELKIKIDEMRSALDRENKAREELQIHYQQRLREKQKEVDMFRSSKEAEVKIERDELEMFKRNLRRELQEVEEELETQRHELNSGFDEAMRRREHEYRVQVDDLSSKVLSYEMKAKLLAKELEVVKAAGELTSTDLKHADCTTRELEKKLKEKEWELTDTKAMKDARIQELENEMRQMENSVERAQQDFQRRHAELDRYAREKETALTAAKDSHNERERSLQDAIRDLQSQLEAKEVEIRRLNWSHADTMKEKDMQLEKMQQGLTDFKSHSDAKLAEVSHSLVSKDLEIQALKSTEEKLRGELAQRKEDVERYKKELSQAMERETSLERAKTQLELDWQRRCEDTERQQYQNTEELVQKLTLSRDEALALVKERERELLQREDLIRVLSQDRDQATATLRQHGLTIDRHILPTRDRGGEDDEPSPSQQIQSLQRQNENLKQVISQMRQEMETLGNQTGGRDGESKKDGKVTGGEGGRITEEYVQALEKEVRELKTKTRHLEEKGSTEPVSVPVNVDNAFVRSHIQSLNDVIGALRADKVEATAQMKKKQARNEHLEAMVNQLTQQAKQKQLEADQLQYEVATQQRRYNSEIALLRQQIAELQLQLAETRKEADEYFKGGLERNLEATALGQEVSALKMDMAGRKPTLIASSQNALVRQLQEEVQYLRNQLNSTSRQPVMGDTMIGGGDSMASMQAKLRTAARHITQLAKERQHLIELGNKLRSELIKYTGRRPTSPPIPHHPTSLQEQKPTVTAGGQLAEHYQTKLSDLERLQYEITKQELKFAQRDKEMDFERGAGDEERPTKPKERPIMHQERPTMHQDRPVVHQPMHSDDIQRQQITRQPRPALQPDLQATLSTIGSGRAGSPLMMSLSSYGEGSIQDLWRMLDEGPSPSPTFMRSPSPPVHLPHNTAGSGSFEPRPSIPDNRTAPSSDGFTIEGSRPAMSGRQKPGKQQLSSLAAGKYQRRPQKPKIRNYNVQD
ncbi:coiled-coil domain-containing protein 57-like [Ptychodera flava]|uniref:coiled-coil domain-containing protein 57-like n=1 Tax=Ptychodera flava TaxID=63121 RepID=UPI003969F458